MKANYVQCNQSCNQGRECVCDPDGSYNEWAYQVLIYIYLVSISGIVGFVLGVRT